MRKPVVPPFCLRTKLDANPILHRSFTDFAPTLVRRQNEGTTKAQRIFKRPCTYPKIIKLMLAIFCVNITLHVYMVRFPPYLSPDLDQ